MRWWVFFICAALCLAAAAVGAFIRSKTRYRRGRLLDPAKIFFAGIVVSAVLLFIPIYMDTFKDGDCGAFETFLIAIHNMIRLFIVDGEFEFITTHLSGLSVGLSRAYTVFFSFLFVVAPLMTFGFVLSFFKNVSAYKRYLTHFYSNAYIFSELNEKSIALAESLFKNDKKKRIFVFTDVFEKDEEECYELIERAKEIGAICFKKDIVTIDFSWHSKKAQLNFFAIGVDLSENISQSLSLIERFKYRENTNLYVFSTQVESELLLTNAFNQEHKEGMTETKIKVRRVNEVQSLISRTLFDVGYDKIFCSAYEDEKGTKQISALVVGMGNHGKEMTKALAWFCQMDGYEVRINSFDSDPRACDKLTALCPELMDPRFNGVFDVEGEAKYEIRVHSGVDVETKSFEDAVASLPRVTYVFVALGNDEKNISTAVRLRALFARLGYAPKIHAVVYNADKKEALTGITNFKNQKYDIDFIGDIRTSYSEAVILDSDVEAAALKRHMMWGKEKEFWQYDYNYKSSIASAIHRKMKSLCNIPGIDKAPSERTEEELWGIRTLEHCRWNAYMRSEGYAYGGTVEKEGRNDLAKLHNCLVPFRDLPLKEQEKDDD
ncbi:MAG: hypothetical protein E7647_04585 [Ruminococcaceae bacterium]|nr:hypothetical protein [Oscillospiraceae bacterium]